MKILIAEDDEVSRRILQLTLAASGHQIISTQSGTEALSILESETAPPLAVLDWMMPGMDGLEVCRRIRQIQTRTPVYLILLTAKGSKTDIVEGLDAGANDYIVKPFDREELRARVKVGEMVVNLQQRLAVQVKELEEALVQVKQLQGILPICSYCKNIRDDKNYWEQLESYISRHSGAKFSHSVCPSCYETEVIPQFEQKNKEQD